MTECYCYCHRSYDVCRAVRMVNGKKELGCCEGGNIYG